MILAVPRADAGDWLADAIVPWRSADAGRAAHWVERAHAEQDESLVQIIPYALLIAGDGRPWAYRRIGGDQRLRERRSIGVGGHVEAIDARADLRQTIQAALARELAEELIAPPTMADPHPLAWINEQATPIGRVHLGLIFVCRWTDLAAPRPRPGQGLESIGFVEPAAVAPDAGYETWSMLAIRALALARSP